MISFSSRGSFRNLERFLKNVQKLDVSDIFHTAGREGVVALSAATPRESGLASTSWRYEVIKTRTGISIVWTNSDVEDGFPVVIRLQYGYSTGTGGYVQGQDFINPAIRPIFERISDRIGKAVRAA